MWVYMREIGVLWCSFKGGFFVLIDNVKAAKYIDCIC